MKYDLVVIGSGPGGYIGAIRASQLGMKVALIEKGELGGTCLNSGCIPTKTLIAHSHVYKTIQNAKAFGIEVQGVSFDYAKMKERKDIVVQELRNGVSTLMKANGVKVYQGIGSLISKTEVQVVGEKTERLETKHILIATGSISTSIPSFPVDGKVIHDSTSILEISKLPKEIVILGGGYIGCEFACIFSLLGVKVTIIEALESIVELQGKTVSDFLSKSLMKKGINIKTKTMMKEAKVIDNEVHCTLTDGKIIKSDMLLVCVGRRPYTEKLDLDKVGLGKDKSGFIAVNDHMQTLTDSIYAIGDVTGKMMLAHVASHQAIVAVECMSGKRSKMHYESVPAVIFTDPEVAMAGITQEDAKKEGRKVKSHKFPYSSLGKAKASQHEEGFFELLIDEDTEKIVGATVIGDNAGNLIGEITLAINNELTLECVFETIHAHPTLSEGWMEASLLSFGIPLHVPPTKNND